MANPAGYDPQVARVLAQLASLATQDPKSVFLPDGWVMLKSFAATRPTFANAQGFYARGPLNGAPAVVAAVGLGWSDLLNHYFDGTPPPIPVSAKLGDGIPSDARLDLITWQLYDGLRQPLWDELDQAKGVPFYVTGLGLGSPLAQLAALDLVAGHAGPGGKPSPAAPPTCYAFSAAPSGNAELAGYYASKVASSYNVWAGSPGLAVDFWPTEPTSAQDYAPFGAAVALTDARIPPYDDPWVERSGGFYVTTLKGTPDYPPTHPGGVPNPPAGFNRPLAYTLAQLSAAVYQERQHPGLGLSLPGGFSAAGNVTSAGDVYCTLFENPSSVVAAFRGPVTWAEFTAVTASSYGAPPEFLDSEFAVVPTGVLGVYTAPEGDNPDDTPFRTVLAQRIAGLLKGRTLYLAGHDSGGALATLAAVDLAQNQPSTPVAALYTFGSTPVGSFDFVSMMKGLSSFQVARPGDFAPALRLDGSYAPTPARVTLTGTPPNDDPAQHAISGYIWLLNPTSGVTRSAEDETAAEQAFQAVLARAGIDPAQVPGHPQAAGSRAIAAGGPASLPAVPLADGRGVGFAARTLVVRASEPLVVAGEDPVVLAVGTLVLEDGARVAVSTPCSLHAAAVEARYGATFEFVGLDGRPGLAGSPGSMGGQGPYGAPGASGGQGGTGGQGGPGGSGTKGLPGPSGTLNLGTINGVLLVRAAGGAGGSGGNGGPGGTGGAGGPGGGSGARPGRGGTGGRGGNGADGADGGDGGTVMVYYGEYLPGSRIDADTPESSGGVGGSGGAGGRGGEGSPGGDAGPPGSGGDYGQRGAAAEVKILPAAS